MTLSAGGGKPELKAARWVTQKSYPALLVVDRIYIALFSAREQTLRSHVILQFQLYVALRPQKPYGLLGTATSTFTQLQSSASV